MTVYLYILIHVYCTCVYGKRCKLSGVNSSSLFHSFLGLSGTRMSTETPPLTLPVSKKGPGGNFQIIGGKIWPNWFRKKMNASGPWVLTVSIRIEQYLVFYLMFLHYLNRLTQDLRRAVSYNGKWFRPMVPPPGHPITPSPFIKKTRWNPRSPMPTG